MQHSVLAEAEVWNVQGQTGRPPTRIPDVDYAKHPAYGAQFGRPTLADRVKALVWLAPALAGFTALELRQALRRLRSASGRGAIDQKFAEQGFLLQRLRPEAKAALIEALAPQRAELEARLDAIPAEKRGYTDAQLLVDRKLNENAYRVLEDELRRLGVLNLAKAYVTGSMGAVKYFVLQINDEGESHWRERFQDVGVPDSPANFLHVDTGVGVMKTIIYLTEVAPENGATSYVPGSHRMSRNVYDRIVRSATDHCGIGHPRPEARRAFSALPRFLQRKADFGKDVFEVTEPVRVFLDNEVVATSQVGDILIFDNMGAHRGGMVQKGRRMILQVVIH